MRIKRTNGWIVLSNLIGYIGVIAGLLICGAVAVLKYFGYKISVPVLWAEGRPLVEITWRHFIYAGIAIGAVIVVSVIFRLIGKAVYKRRVKKAIEEARKANSSSGNLQGYSIDPEMIEAAKKVLPVLAVVAVTCMVAKTVKNASDRRRMEAMCAPRYYRY